MNWKNDYHGEIKNAIDVCKKAQRNYNLNKRLPRKDLETLIYVASNSPSKQNETHFNLRVYTDVETITNIYKRTKNFTFSTNTRTEEIFTTTGVQKDQKYSVTNSQIKANAVFVYCDDTRNIRGGTHLTALREDAGPIAKETLFEQKAMSIGISSGQLVMAAALLGYKTGYCSAFEKTGKESVQNYLQIESEPRLIVGVGYPHPNLKRKQHPDVYNRDIGIKEGKHGKDDENWIYPSMIEEDMIKEAYYNYQKIDVWLNDKRVDINKI